MIRLMLTMLFALLQWSSSASSNELENMWPQWRGPFRNGTVPLTSAWPSSIDESVLRQSWRVELGPSYSGPIVAADRVFVTETRGKQVEVVWALSRSDGKVLWSREWPGAMSVPFFAKSNGDWIRATPAFDGESLFVAGMRDLLVCLDAETGKERWRIDFVERYKSPLPTFGFVSSPLVEGSFVYVQAGAAFVKIDKRTGETIWRSLEDNGGMNGSAFSSPMRSTIAGQPQLLVQTRDRLAGVDEATGNVLWSQAIESFRGMNILTPLVFENSIFTSSYGGKSWLFDLKQTSNSAAGKSISVVERWQNKVQGYMSTPILIDGHIYAHLKNQRFACIEASTGKECWVTSPFGKYWSLVAQGNKILALDERGDLLLINANPNKFELINRRHVSDSTTWAHLAVCGEDVLIRDLGAITAYRWRKPVE